MLSVRTDELVAPVTLLFGFSASVESLESEAEPVWMDQLGASVWQSDNCTGPPLNYMQRNVPQSNVTGQQ